VNRPVASFVTQIRPFLCVLLLAMHKATSRLTSTLLDAVHNRHLWTSGPGHTGRSDHVMPKG
jgi:hypothetical protein